ncbi:MAG: hypothetical protein RIT81_23915 [Deltaproteobacteria bacterium]
MRMHHAVLGALLLSGCVGETLDLTGEGGETATALESLTVETSVSPSKWGSTPSMAILGSGPDARVQMLDAQGRTVFDQPGVPPFAVTIAVSPGRHWTKLGVRTERVVFEDIRSQYADPVDIWGQLVDMPEGDSLEVLVIDRTDSHHATDLHVEPDGLYTFKLPNDLNDPAVVVATVLRGREPIAHGVGAIDAATNRADVVFDHLVSKTADVVVEGVAEGLTGGLVRAGFGIDDLVRYNNYIPEGHDYRAVPRIPVPESAFASFETYVAIDRLPSRRRQAGQWPVRADGSVESLQLLELPTLGLDVGSGASAVRYDEVPTIRYELPAGAEGTVVIAEALITEKLFQEQCRSLEWRIDVDPLANELEIPELPVVPGLRVLPRGVPLTVELEAKKDDLVSATSGSVVFGGTPDCANHEPLPEWAVGSFVNNPAEGCWLSRFTVSSCGEYRAEYDVIGVVVHDCGYLNSDPDLDLLEFASLIGSGGTFDLHPADIAFDMSVPERGRRYVKVGDLESASVPNAIVGRWVVDRVTSTLVDVPDDTPLAGDLLPDDASREHGLFEIDHRGQLFTSRNDFGSPRGAITSWSNGVGTVRYSNNAGMCSSVDRSARLTMIDAEHLVLERVERLPDAYDRDGDGETNDAVAFERKLFLVPFSP